MAIKTKIKGGDEKPRKVRIKIPPYGKEYLRGEILKFREAGVTGSRKIGAALGVSHTLINEIRKELHGL